MVTYLSYASMFQRFAFPYQIPQLLLGCKAILDHKVEVASGQFQLPTCPQVHFVGAKDAYRQTTKTLFCTETRRWELLMASCTMYVNPRTKTFPFSDASIAPVQDRAALQAGHLQRVHNELNNPRYG